VIVHRVSTGAVDFSEYVDAKPENVDGDNPHQMVSTDLMWYQGFDDAFVSFDGSQYDNEYALKVFFNDKLLKDTELDRKSVFGSTIIFDLTIELTNDFNGSYETHYHPYYEEIKNDYNDLVKGTKFKYEYEGALVLFKIRNYDQRNDDTGILPAPCASNYFRSYQAYLMIRDEWHENNTYRPKDFDDDKPFLSYAYYENIRYDVNHSGANDVRPDEGYQYEDQSTGEPWIKIVDD